MEKYVANKQIIINDTGSPRVTRIKEGCQHERSPDRKCPDSRHHGEEEEAREVGFSAHPADARQGGYQPPEQEGGSCSAYGSGGKIISGMLNSIESHQTLSDYKQFLFSFL